MTFSPGIGRPDGRHHHAHPELRDEFAQQVTVTKHQGFSTVEVRGLAEVA
ncbi:MAG TPA: hypothetical protein VN493_01440 [Thermoanaerobaculia bacterium]|nr:hypothetical protein [Thermoanaerobaculia bacterium]